MWSSYHILLHDRLHPYDASTETGRETKRNRPGLRDVTNQDEFLTATLVNIKVKLEAFIGRVLRGEGILHYAALQDDRR